MADSPVPIEDINKVYTYEVRQPDCPEDQRWAAAHYPHHWRGMNWVCFGPTEEAARTKLMDYLTGKTQLMNKTRRAEKRRAEEEARRAAEPPPPPVIEVRRMVPRPAATVPAPRIRHRPQA